MARRYQKIERLIESWNKAEFVKDTLEAARLRDTLEEELAKTVPRRCMTDLVIPYLDYLKQGGCLTYDQWFGLIEEQKLEVAKPIDTSEDPSPF